MNDNNNDNFCMFRKTFSREGKQSLSWVIDDGYPKIFDNVDDCLNAIMLDILSAMSTKDDDGTARFWCVASSIHNSLKTKVWNSYVYGDTMWGFCHISEVKHDDDKIHAFFSAVKNNLNKLIDKYENLLTNTSKNGECATVESITREINKNMSLLSELLK